MGSNTSQVLMKDWTSMFIGLVHCEGQIEAKLHACSKAWYYGETSSSKKKECGQINSRNNTWTNPLEMPQ
jgi:hypothetical protein